MSALTVRLPDKVANEVNIRAKRLHITRGEYVRKCIEDMNKKLRAEERRENFIKASKKVRKESMVVNSEFAKIENDN